jgi:hypothetical protein
MDIARSSSRKVGLDIALILVVSALTFLPHVQGLTFYRDDWYYIMDGQLAGADAFLTMFQIDRPARGLVFLLEFMLFGTHPIGYHLSAYIWRLAGGLAALWLFRLLWPRQRWATLCMALFFTIFPGYLWWVAGVEYQPMIISACLQVVSIALTLQAIRAARPAAKILLWLSSILSGWAYIALVDYAIGMEAFRLFCVFVLVNREHAGLPLLKKFLQTLRAWAAAALIPGIFLVWRLFIFNNQRRETDVSLQLSALVNSPVNTGFWWLMHLFESTLNVAVLAWAAPLGRAFFELRLRDILMGLAITAAVTLCVLLGKRLAGDQETDDQPLPWQTEAFWLGLLGVACGVLPVIMANRNVLFQRYSHYALPASLASAAFVIALVYSVKSHKVQIALICALAAGAVMTHYTNAVNTVTEEQTINNFWWQFSWRAAGIRPGTTLMVTYPNVGYGEDTDAVSGPANMIYYPKQGDQAQAYYQLSAIPKIRETTQEVLVGQKKDSVTYRSHTVEINYSNLLVASQPGEASCVHVIDSRWPRYSTLDEEQVLLVGSHSILDNVLTGSEAARPPEYLFGAEPPHQWCYFYEKAEEALQQNDLEQILRLGEEVQQKGLHPVDRVEWLPFLQAYAASGKTQQVAEISTKINEFPYLQLQSCRTLLSTESEFGNFTAEVQGQVQDLFCQGRQP